jgi:hypothetical protein
VSPDEGIRVLSNRSVSPDSIAMPGNNRDHRGLALCLKIKGYTKRLKQAVHPRVLRISDPYLGDERADVLSTDKWTVGGKFTLIDAENESCHV